MAVFPASYSQIEFIGGYGFIGLFVAAVALRNSEHSRVYQKELHDVAEMGEQLLTAVVMILFGGLIAHGLFAPLN